MKPYIASHKLSSCYEVKHDDVSCYYNHKSTRQYAKKIIAEGILDHRESTWDDFDIQPKAPSRKAKRLLRHKARVRKFRKKFFI